MILAILFRSFVFFCSQKHFASQSSVYERLWWRLLQKRTLHTKLGVYVFIWIICLSRYVYKHTYMVIINDWNTCVLTVWTDCIVLLPSNYPWQHYISIYLAVNNRMKKKTKTKTKNKTKNTTQSKELKNLIENW